MKKADYLGSRALKGAMAVVLAVGLCPVAPAMAQEGATTSGEGGAESSSIEAPADDAATSIDEAGAEENGAAQLECVFREYQFANRCRQCCFAWRIGPE